MSSSQGSELGGRLAHPAHPASDRPDSRTHQERFSHAPLTIPNNIRLIWVEPGQQDEPVSVSMFESLCKKRWCRPRRERMYGTPFSYESKDLLRMLPNRGSPGRLLVSSRSAMRNSIHGIKHTDYMALSYVWGDATDTLPIRVNGCHQQITRNLYHFFEQVRSDIHRQGPYWVDALCINQNDNEEKSKQVMMMGDIYSNCSMCIAWIGEEDDHTKAALELLRAVDTKIHLALTEASKDRSQYRRYSRSEEHLFRRRLFTCPQFERVLKDLNIWRVGEEPFTSFHWAAAFDVLSRPWFQRIWTLQEFVFPRNLEIVCGSHKLDDVALMTFARLSGLIEPEQDDSPIFQKFVSLNRELSTFLYGACLLRAQYDSIPPKASIAFEASFTGRRRQSTNPRDKVYALMSFSGPVPGFAANYSRPVREVYQDFAVCTIRRGYREDMLDLFNAIGLPGAVSGLPSWAPDWTFTVQPPVTFTSKSDFTRQALRFMGNWRAWAQTYGGSEKPLYKGAGGRDSTLNFSTNLMLLKADGVHFDTIKRVHLGLHEKLYWNRLQEYIIQEGLDKESFQPANESREDILYRTACCDMMGLALGGFIRHSKTTNMERLEASGIRPLIELSEDRVLVITQAGYMGLAPQSSQVGDIVAILVGQPFPFILRRSDGELSMIGLSYVHGIMDGEVMKEVKAGKRVIQNFEIR